MHEGIYVNLLRELQTCFQASIPWISSSGVRASVPVGHGRDEGPATIEAAFRSVEIAQVLPSWFDRIGSRGLRNADGFLSRDGPGVDQ
jgi:hypothetical protein